MRSLFYLPVLISLIQACPFHTEGDHDPAVMEANIAAANLRKRTVTQQSSSKIAITNVYVFDGFELSNETSTVVIDGAVVGNDSTGATVYDGQGGTLMPGLFDNHNHPTTLDHLRNLSSWGVTTTICMSCWHIPDRCASLRNQTGLTDFYSSGLSALVAGSAHAKMAGASNNQTITNPSMCSNWVEGQIETGSNFIKLVAEATPPTMSQEEHNAIVRTAHEHDLRTATHASTLLAYETAVRSQSNFIQHTPSDGLLNASLIAQIIANGQHSTPTMMVYQYAQSGFNISDSQAALLNETVPANVKKMYDAGVPILAGTDSADGASAPIHVPFGAALHSELESLVSAGIPNLDVLKAATSRPAYAYNMIDRGVIAPGLRADLILIRGNPLVNISKTREIEKVWITGMEYGSSS